MKKHLFFTLTLLLLAVWMSSLPFYAETDDGNTVVYLADGGKGDGSSAESPVGSLTKAYDTLDLTKDCTVVLVGKFTQSANFTRTASYTGSVTLTSVYGSTDYRKTNNAVYEVNNKRFYLFGETTFEHMDFNVTGDFMLTIAQHNKITVGEGVTITGSKLSGGTVAKAFSILGGYQDGASTAANTLDTDITVLSGSKIYIVAFARGNKGAPSYTGTAHIKIGGDAEVSTLHLTGVDRNNVKYGKTVAEITDNAAVDAIYGATQQVTADAFSLTWRSGTIGKFEPVCSATPNASISYTNGTTLHAAAAVRAASNFSAVAKQFDSVKCLDHAFGEWMPTTPAGFGTKGEEKRTCAYCDAFETREIPALTAKLELDSISAKTDETGVGTIRMIAKLMTTADAKVTRYGIFVARTDAIGTAKVAEWTATTGTETAFALDLSEIPHSELDTPIYAWAFVEADGVQIPLPIAAGVSVNAILKNMGA